MGIVSAFNEKDLLRQVAKGDTHAFTVIYEFYQHKIYTFCLPIVHSELLAEEIMQEVMLKIWRMGYQLESINNLDGYLKTIARNRAIDLLRQQRLKERTDAERSRDWSDDHNETEEQILLQDARRILEEAIERLPRQQKKVYRLAEQEGVKSDEIAQRLALSPATVQTHLKLARKSLREYLRKHLDLAMVLILLKLF